MGEIVKKLTRFLDALLLLKHKLTGSRDLGSKLPSPCSVLGKQTQASCVAIPEIAYRCRNKTQANKTQASSRMPRNDSAESVQRLWSLWDELPQPPSKKLFV
jgi:hypothetical protein